MPDGVIADYEAVVEKVDLASIAARERVTRHDVKARIEEFCALAGHEHIHKGMTSRDLTENVEQLQIRASLGLIRTRVLATLGPAGPARGRARGAGDDRALAQRRRPGDHPRQAVRHAWPTRCWWRSAGSTTCSRATRCAASRARWAPPRTCSTCSTARPAKLADLEQRVARHLGFDEVLTSVGQVYPRSLDFDVVSALVQLVAGPVQPGHHDPADGRASSWSPRASRRARSAPRRCRTR